MTSELDCLSAKDTSKGWRIAFTNSPPQATCVNDGNEYDTSFADRFGFSSCLESSDDRSSVRTWSILTVSRENWGVQVDRCRRISWSFRLWRSYCPH